MTVATPTTIMVYAIIPKILGYKENHFSHMVQVTCFLSYFFCIITIMGFIKPAKVSKTNEHASCWICELLHLIWQTHELKFWNFEFKLKLKPKEKRKKIKRRPSPRGCAVSGRPTTAWRWHSRTWGSASSLASMHAASERTPTFGPSP